VSGSRSAAAGNALERRLPTTATRRFADWGSPPATRRGLLAALGVPTLVVPSRARERSAALTIGAGGRFPTLAAAIAEARNDDLLLLAPGRYENDFTQVSKRLTLRCADGIAHLVATRPPPNGKAILVIGADATLQGLAFSGSRVRNLNGAGIRYEGGHLRLRGCRFEDNEMNLLAAPDPAGSITVERCAFGPTSPVPVQASLAHGLYVNQVGLLRVQDSLFHGAASGHQIKSRALATVITGTRISDGPAQGSYSVDLPNGGRAVIEDNVIEQGPNTGNPAIIHFGGEGAPHADSALRISRNLVVNRYQGPDAVLLRNQTETQAVLEDNRVFGLTAAQLAVGPAEARGTVWLDAAAPFDFFNP
jgi:hypothetical protein